MNIMKMKHYLLTVAALVVSVAVSAQSSNTFADERLSLSGYLQGGVRYDDSQAGSESTFYLKRARVSLTGNAAEEKIDYRLQVDMAKSPKICDLYFRYKPSSAFGMQLGQFKVPFAIENDIYGPTTVEFIDYSYITTLLARNDGEYDGIASTGRDIGFQIYGGFGDQKDYKTLSYNLAVFNGAGINTDDTNEAKDVVARLIYKPTKELSLSGSMMTTRTTITTSELKLSGGESLEDIKLDTVTTTTNTNSYRWSAGVIYDAKSFIVRGEYAGAEFGDKDVDAFYVMGGYKIKKDWMLVARYESLNEEMDIVDDDMINNRVTLGAVYKPYSFLRLQLNYWLEDSGLEDAKNRVNRGGLNFMVTAIF